MRCERCGRKRCECRPCTRCHKPTPGFRKRTKGNRLSRKVEAVHCDDCTWDALAEVANEERAQTCPHGKQHGECSACDVAGDLAFDAAREARMFR